MRQTSRLRRDVIYAGRRVVGRYPCSRAAGDSGYRDLSAAALTAESLSIVEANRHEGQLHSWNLAYQRTLPGDFSAEVAYVGNRGKTFWRPSI